MGLYINPPVVKGKLSWLLTNYPELKKTGDPLYDKIGQGKVLLAVIENPDFDSVVVMDDQDMVDSLWLGDPRKITFVIAPKDSITLMVTNGLVDGTIFDHPCLR